MNKVRTIYDIAHLAGVSASTVSRALSGNNAVNPTTMKRIRRIAAEHGFQPNLQARGLRTRRRGAIGVVIPLGHERTQHISDPFFMQIIGHLADELTGRGYELVLSRVIPDHSDWLERMIEADRVDGIVVIGQSDQGAVLDAAARHYQPMVAWGGFAPGQVHCSVGTDNFLGGQIAVEHLIARGCRDIAFFGNPQGVEIAQRRDGARAAVARAEGVTLTEIPTHLVTDMGGDDIARFLDHAARVPDGVFAASDMIALTAIQALLQRGRAVPDEVRVVGFDDLPLARGALPPLTTVRQDIAGGAMQLVDCLFRRIDGRPAGSVVLNPELIVRGSS